jgi:mono/diheme cytochrome c family protein
MKRFFNNLLIDLIAAASMIGMLATGYILRFPLPPGSNKYLTLWGLTRHEWGDIHFWISLGLLGVVLLHVCLHWQWLAISVKRRLSRTKAAPGSALVSALTTFLVLVAVLVLFGWAAQNGVNHITEPREGVCPPSGPETGNTAGDADGTTSKTPAVGGPLGVAFWKDVYPILERSCLSCHGPRKQLGGFRADRREDFFGKGGTTPLVVPGKIAESPLIAIVSGLRKDMPRADVHQLSHEKVAVLRAWIDAGAPWPERSGQE